MHFALSNKIDFMSWKTCNCFCRSAKDILLSSKVYHFSKLTCIKRRLLGFLRSPFAYWKTTKLMVSHLSSFNHSFQCVYYQMLIPKTSEESYSSDKLRPSGISFLGFLRSCNAGYSKDLLGHICTGALSDGISVPLKWLPITEQWQMFYLFRVYHWNRAYLNVGYLQIVSAFCQISLAICCSTLHCFAFIPLIFCSAVYFAHEELNGFLWFIEFKVVLDIPRNI